MITERLDGLDAGCHDLCIVGAGPVGLTLALEWARRGRRVLVLESGGRKPDAETTALSAAEIADPARHDAMTIAVARRLGGTSNLWAGRCQPFDPIDFEPRPMVGDARWPFGLDELAPHYAAACAYAGCGAPVFRDALPDVGRGRADDAFDAGRLERFSNQPKFHKAHAAALENDPRIDLRLNATVVDAVFAETGRIAGLLVAGPDGTRVRVAADRVVLACGGLETARLLLAFRRDRPDRFGGADGPLGRGYMGHLIGEVADITFADAATEAAFDFYRDGRGSYARRRMIPSDALQRAEALPNVSFWPVVPPSADPRHGSAILSAVLLALSVGPLGRMVVAEAIRKRHVPDRFDRWPHVLNVLRGLPAAAAFLPAFLLRRRFARERLPGFFVRNAARTYGLSYHAEHWPDRSSRVWLTAETDRLGLPRLGIDLRFSPDNAEGVLRAHDALGAWLERSRLGRMTWRGPRESAADAILAKAAHGTHQIGVARMGLSRATAVVDGTLACFDCPNLHVVGTAVLPTSGQANPTLTAIALAVRLAGHLAGEGGSGTPALSSSPAAP